LTPLFERKKTWKTFFLKIKINQFRKKVLFKNNRSFLRVLNKKSRVSQKRALPDVSIRFQSPTDNFSCFQTPFDRTTPKIIAKVVGA